MRHMNETLNLMRILGECWRDDMHNYDGDILKEQLNKLIEIGMRELCECYVTTDLEIFCEEYRICFTCETWRMYCNCPLESP
jgi:hypothetical protein